MDLIKDLLLLGGSFIIYDMTLKVEKLEADVRRTKTELSEMKNEMKNDVNRLRRDLEESGIEVNRGGVIFVNGDGQTINK